MTMAGFAQPLTASERDIGRKAEVPVQRLRRRTDPFAAAAAALTVKEFFMRLIHPMPAVCAVTLLAAGFASNLFLSCGSNLVAFGVVAALTLGLRRGALVALGIWLESQVLGFTVFAYPHASMTVAWGLALGVGTVLAAAIASACAARGPILAFAAAFTLYELSLAAFSLATGGGLAEFTPAIIGQLLISNVAVAIGVAVLYRIVSAAHVSLGERFARVRHS